MVSPFGTVFCIYNHCTKNNKKSSIIVLFYSNEIIIAIMIFINLYFLSNLFVKIDLFYREGWDSDENICNFFDFYLHSFVGDEFFFL